MQSSVLPQKKLSLHICLWGVNLDVPVCLPARFWRCGAEAGRARVHGWILRDADARVAGCSLTPLWANPQKHLGQSSLTEILNHWIPGQIFYSESVFFFFFCWLTATCSFKSWSEGSSTVSLMTNVYFRVQAIPNHMMQSHSWMLERGIDLQNWLIVLALKVAMIHIEYVEDLYDTFL